MRLLIAALALLATACTTTTPAGTQATGEPMVARS